MPTGWPSCSGVVDCARCIACKHLGCPGNPPTTCDPPNVSRTSSIFFAILGLRSLSFALAGVLPRLRYLYHAPSIILVGIGVKMFLAEWYRPPTGLTLGAVVAILAVATLLSLSRRSDVSVSVTAAGGDGTSGERPA